MRLTWPRPHVGGHTRRPMWWVTSRLLHGCGRGQATMTPLLSLLHTPTWRPNATSTPRFLIHGTSSHAQALANRLKNARVSLDHRPPTSTNYQLCSAVGADEFWVRSDLLSLCNFQSHPVLQCNVPPRGSISMQCAHQSGVHCQLSSPSKWQTFHNDFPVHPPPLVLASPCLTSSCLAAHPRCSALQSFSRDAQ